MARRRGSGATTWLLAGEAGGSFDYVGTARRPSAPGGAEPSRGQLPLAARRRIVRSGQAIGAGRGGDSVYDAAGGLATASGPLQRSGGPPGGDSDRQPDPGGVGGGGGFLHQHAGAAGQGRMGGSVPGVLV